MFGIMLALDVVSCRSTSLKQEFLLIGEIYVHLEIPPCLEGPGILITQGEVVCAGGGITSVDRVHILGGILRWHSARAGKKTYKISVWPRGLIWTASSHSPSDVIRVEMCFTCIVMDQSDHFQSDRRAI